MKYDDLKGKRVLLLMPRFFNYSTLLINELEHRGAIVDFVENRLHSLDPASPQCRMRLLRFFYYYLFNIRWQYLKAQVDVNAKYDIFFCINGFSFDKRIVALLKKTNPDIKCVLYLWDSINMFEWKGITAYFDKSFTFDPIDAEHLKIEYLANFYPKNIHISEKTPIYDLFFIGTQHADRFNVLNKILNSSYSVSSDAIKLLIKYRNVLHNKILYKLLLRINNPYAKNYILNYELIERKIEADFLIYLPFDSDIVLDMMENSRCVLDIQAPTQVGLPHQLIQALAMGKKIITVNNWISNYDFYNPDQILIINRENPIISQDFLKTDFKVKEINKTIICSRIDNWVDIILS